MNQTDARRRAKELNGVAIHAYRKSEGSGPSAGWRIGGWPHQKGETWIVVSQDLSTVLDDSPSPDEEHPVPDRPVYRATAAPAPMSDGTTWWVVEVQGLPEGNTPVTQGRDREDAHAMTRDLIALLLDVDEDSFDIDITFIEDTKE